jgi:transcriptional repressor NrdR
MEVEEVVNRVTSKLYELGTDEVTSRQVGEAILDVLAEVNEVAYIRFASVFQEFKTLEEFEQIIKQQKAKKAKKK